MVTLDTLDGCVRISLESGRSDLFETEKPELYHPFAEVSVGDIFGEGHTYLEKPFRMANQFRPKPMEEFCPRALLAIRQLHDNSLTGLYFAHKFLFVVAFGIQEVSYPPKITARMVVDLSCHLWASWAYFTTLITTKDPSCRLEHFTRHTTGCIDFARFLLVEHNLFGAKDWPLRFIVYKTPSPKDKKTLTKDKFSWIRILPVEQSAPPLSSEHVSQSKGDRAYTRYLVGHHNVQLPLLELL